MKTLSIILLLASIGWACDEGCTEWKDSCACEAKKGSAPEETNYASDEEPPKHPQPEWERGLVNVIRVPELSAQDHAYDQEKAKADLEGKKAAGIK